VVALTLVQLVMGWIVGKPTLISSWLIYLAKGFSHVLLSKALFKQLYRSER
jgi:hypothetical protein